MTPLIRIASVVAAALAVLVVAGTQAFAAPPTVTSISPNAGSTSGDSILSQTTITGTNFTGATSVSIGGSTATILSVDSDTQIRVRAPAGIAGVADVVVFTPDGNSGTSGQFLYTYFGGSPSISTVSPAFGLTTGGNTISINGSNFVPGTGPGPSFTLATSVTIGGVPATNVQVTSTVSLTATVPAGTAGAAAVVVTTAGGSGGGVNYLYITPATPVIIAVTNENASSPFFHTSSGTSQGGDKVTITGTNFIGATAVTFDTTPVSFTINSAGSITTTTPTHAAGPVNVSVTVAAASPATGTGTGAFTFVTPPPTISTLSPTSGTTAGGTNVTILGTFLATTTSVTFDTTPIPCPSASCTVVSDTQLKVTSPAHAAGLVTVTVTTPSGTATKDYTYGTPPPTVASISPASGSVNGGAPVTITGTGFTGATAVTIGGTAATSVVVVNDTTITATTPAHTAGVVNVAVTTPAGTGTGALYNYTASPPTVTAVTPSFGPPHGGTLITITGANFSGQPQVTVGGVQTKDVAVISTTEIQAVTPAGTGIKDVVVTTAFGTSIISAADQFTYASLTPPTPPAPTVTAISPTSGTTLGGTPVTITGTDFTGATAVTIGGNPATNVIVVGPTAITAITPAGSLGARDVAVTTPGGTGIGAGLYTYVTAAPTVTAVSPNSGTTLGGVPVTITGTNFTGATAVTIGGNPATNVTVLNANTITATTPSHASGPVNVAVTTPAGTGTGISLYSYVAGSPPTVTALSPNSGNSAGGTAVTITGTNFTGATAVTIGGTAATFVTVISATSITAISPAHAAGVVDVAVTTPAGTGTGTGLFTYFAPPTVTGISPNSGPIAGGSVVTITGTNFTGATAVKFGSTPATSFTVNGPTSIMATLPPGAGTANVTVTTPGGTSVTTPAGQFTYLGPAPTVTGLSPNSGLTTGGTIVTITGANLTGATAVKFGSTAATSFTVISATSITATAPAGAAGAVDVTVTTANGTSVVSASDSFTYTKAFTSMTFTSTPNPSQVGEPVTFTAKITGNSPTGNVTFTLNNLVIGTAPLNTSGVATFVTSALPAGSNPVTASYPGDANNLPDPVTVNQIVGPNAPADSINLRRMQLAVMPIVANVAGDTLRSAIDNAISAGFTGVSQPITPNGSGFIYYFVAPDSQPSRKLDALDRMPLSDEARLKAGFDAIDAYAPPPPRLPNAAPVGTPRRWLAWIDLRGTEFNRTGVNDLKGTHLNAIAGLNFLFTPNFMVGALGGYEQFNFSSQAYNGVLKGSGWTAGAFLAWKLAPTIRFDMAGAYSGIDATNSSGTANGSFNGSRVFASSGLAGTYGIESWMFEPSANFYALWESEKEYVDSLGTLHPARSFYTGRGSAGLKVGYQFGSSSAGLAPYVGLYSDYYFSKDIGTVDALTAVPVIHGWGARAIGGIAANFGGAQVSAGGELSGIGNNTQIWTYRVRGHVPF